MNIALIMLVTYLVLTTAVSLYFTKKSSTSTKQYFVADRSLGTIVVVALLFSEIIAGSGTVGNAATAFTTGFSSVWANWGMAVGCVIFIPLVSKFYRAMAVSRNVMSIPQAYEHMFDKRCKTVMIAIVVVVYVILYSSQAVAAAGIIAPLLGVDSNTVVWVVTGLFILTTITGGMGGIAWMNVFHSAVMYVGMAIVAFKALSTAGGMEVLTSTLPAKHFDFTYPSLATTIASALGTGLSFLASSNVTNSTFSAKSRKAANRGIIIAGLIVIPFALFPALIGICAKVVMPDIAPNSALFSMANSMGGVYGGLVSMAIIAAIWSTAPALLIVICTTMTKDFYVGFMKPDATEAQQMRFSRIVAVVLGIVGSALGLRAAYILSQMLGAFQIRSVVGIVLAVAVFWPRVTSNAAFWSLLFGGIVAAVWQFGGQPFGIAPLWPASAVTLIILIPMTLMSKEKVSPGYRKYQEALKDMYEEEANEG